MSDTEQSRREEIIKWLSTSKLSKPFKSGHGFFVTKGPRVRLKDSSIVDLFDWLIGEGVSDQVSAAGYSVSHTPKGDFPERLSFFESEIEDVPFHPNKTTPNGESKGEDIPF